MEQERKTKGQLCDELYNAALSIIEGENYDIINDGEFTPEDFATAARSIFVAAMRADNEKFWMLRKDAVSVYALGLDWKFKNSMPGYISCSGDDATGVSRSEAWIFGPFRHKVDEYDVRNMLEMMNEAWFQMKN